MGEGWVGVELGVARRLCRSRGAGLWRPSHPDPPHQGEGI